MWRLLCDCIGSDSRIRAVLNPINVSSSSRDPSCQDHSKGPSGAIVCVRHAVIYSPGAHRLLLVNH
jgi:hypothetical protein